MCHTNTPFAEYYKVKICMLSSFIFFLLSLNSVFGQHDLPPLAVELSVGWDATNITAYPFNDAIPVSAQLNRNSYVYFFTVQPNGQIDLDYPSPFLESVKENIIWGGEGQIFLRFVDSGNNDGLMRFFLVTSLEPLTRSDVSQFTTVESFQTASLSTPWHVITGNQAQISNGAIITQASKEASSLWPFYLYILQN